MDHRRRGAGESPWDTGAVDDGGYRRHSCIALALNLRPSHPPSPSHQHITRNPLELGFEYSSPFPATDTQTTPMPPAIDQYHPRTRINRYPPRSHIASPRGPPNRGHHRATQRRNAAVPLFASPPEMAVTSWPVAKRQSRCRRARGPTAGKEGIGPRLAEANAGAPSSPGRVGSARPFLLCLYLVANGSKVYCGTRVNKVVVKQSYS